MGSSYGEEIAEDLSSSEYGSSEGKKQEGEFTQEEMFQINKKLFAEQMRQELSGKPIAKDEEYEEEDVDSWEECKDEEVVKDL